MPHVECPKCRNSDQSKFVGDGHTAAMSPRLRCKACGKRFTVSPQKPGIKPKLIRPNPHPIDLSVCRTVFPKLKWRHAGPWGDRTGAIAYAKGTKYNHLASARDGWLIEVIELNGRFTAEWRSIDLHIITRDRNPAGSDSLSESLADLKNRISARCDRFHQISILIR